MRTQGMGRPRVPTALSRPGALSQAVNQHPLAGGPALRAHAPVIVHPRRPAGHLIQRPAAGVAGAPGTVGLTAARAAPVRAACHRWSKDDLLRLGVELADLLAAPALALAHAVGHEALAAQVV